MDIFWCYFGVNFNGLGVCNGDIDGLILLNNNFCVVLVFVGVEYDFFVFGGFFVVF